LQSIIFFAPTRCGNRFVVQRPANLASTREEQPTRYLSSGKQIELPSTSGERKVHIWHLCLFVQLNLLGFPLYPVLWFGPFLFYGLDFSPLFCPGIESTFCYVFINYKADRQVGAHRE